MVKWLLQLNLFSVMFFLFYSLEFLSPQHHISLVSHTCVSHTQTGITVPQALTYRKIKSSWRAPLPAAVSWVRQQQRLQRPSRWAVRRTECVGQQGCPCLSSCITWGSLAISLPGKGTAACLVYAWYSTEQGFPNSHGHDCPATSNVHNHVQNEILHVM